jgi:hypothetical protein
MLVCSRSRQCDSGGGPIASSILCFFDGPRKRPRGGVCAAEIHSRVLGPHTESFMIVGANMWIPTTVLLRIPQYCPPSDCGMNASLKGSTVCLRVPCNATGLTRVGFFHSLYLTSALQTKPNSRCVEQSHAPPSYLRQPYNSGSSLILRLRLVLHAMTLHVPRISSLLLSRSLSKLTLSFTSSSSLRYLPRNQKTIPFKINSCAFGHRQRGDDAIRSATHTDPLPRICTRRWTKSLIL